MNSHNGMPTPVSGLNDNLEFLGKQLHVQTEKIGFPAGRIVTQVFCGGRVVFSKKTNYTAVASGSDDTDHIRELMQSQHLLVIKGIKDKRARMVGSY